MSTCASCGHVNEAGNAFCQNCGAALAVGDARPAGGVSAVQARAATVGGLERGLYFKVARVVAWVLLAVALGGMAYSLIKLLPAFAAMSAGAADVTEKDVRAAVEQARSSGAGAQQGQDNPFGSASASELAALDQAIYELAGVLPPDAINQFGNMDGFRSWVKSNLQGAGPEDLDDQVDLVEEAKDIISELPAADRVNGVNHYFGLVAQHKAEAEARKAQGKAEAAIYASGFAMSAVTLMMITMTLVLLAIERNTRGQAE